MTVKIPTLNVKKFGAKGDGTTDDTAAFNTAIVAANAQGGGIVVIPSGTYRLDSQIVLLDRVILEGVGPATHLNFASAGAIVNCIKATGSVAATSVAFSAAINKGDTTITYPSAPAGVVVGSVLLIYNSTNSAFNAARTYYRKGEWVKVTGVSGGTVTLDKPVFDSYAAGGATTTYLLTPVVVSMRDLRATFKTGLTGINIEYGAGCVLKDLDLSGTDVSCLSLDRCFESSVNAVRAFDASVAAGANYGVTIGNSQRIQVSNCMLDTTRHGLAIGGGDFVGSVPNRDVLITACIINGHTASLAGADIHGNGEHITYRGNRLLAGIAFGGDYITIADNDIRTTSGASVFGVIASELLGPNLTIVRNRLVAEASLTGGNSAVINFSKNTNAWEFANRSGSLKISDNDMDMVTYDGSGIFVRNGQTNDMLAATGTIDLDVSGNKIHGTTNTSARVGIEIVGQPTGTADKGFRSVRVANNTLVRASLNITASGAQATNVVDNDLLFASVNGINITGGANYHTTYQTEEELLVVENNRVVRPNKTGILVLGSSTGSRSILCVRGNTAVSCIQGGTTGSSATDSSLFASTWNTAFVEHNTFGKLPNDSTSAQIRFMGLDAITKLTENDNLNVGTVVTNFVGTVGNYYRGQIIKTCRRVTTGTSDTLLTSDDVLVVDVAVAFALNLLASPETGRQYKVKQSGAGVVTLTPASGNINGAATYAMTLNEGVTIVYDGTQWVTF